MLRLSRIRSRMVTVILVGVTLLLMSGFAGAKELRFWMTSSPHLEEAMSGLLAEFEAQNPGVDVILEAQPYTVYFEKLTTSFAAGTAPDVFWLDIHTAQFAKQGVLVPLDDYVTQELREDLMGRGFQEGSWNGTVYGVPMHEIASAIFYNQQMIEEAGLQPPTTLAGAWTWDEFLEVAKKLTKDVNNDGIMDQWGFYQERRMQMWGMLPILKQNGGAILSPDGCRAEGYANGPETVEAVQWWGRLVTEHGVMPYDAIPEALPAGKVAMMQSPSYRYDGLIANYPDFDFGVAPMFKGAAGGAVTTGGWNIAISKGTADVALAWKLVDFMVGEGHKTWIEKSGYLPVRKSVLKRMPEYQTYPLNLFVEQLNEIPVGRPASPVFGALYDAWGSVASSVAAGADAQAQLDRFVRRVARDLSSSCRN